MALVEGYRMVPLEDEEEAALLTPDSVKRSHRPRPSWLSLARRWTPRRLPQHLRRPVILVQVLLAIPATFLVLVLVYGGIPPSYSDLRAQERALPQHDWSRRPTEVLTKYVTAGEENQRYLRFPDHLKGHGFNNILEEALISYHLAHTNNRTYVFEDYVWSQLPFPYTLYDFTLRPTRVPIGAFLGGVLAGIHNNTLEQNTSISAEYFDYICPPSERVEIVYGSPGDEESSTSKPYPKNGASAMEIFDWWSTRLSQPDVRDSRCLLAREYRRRIMDWDFFGTERILEIFPSLRKSPALKYFQFSHLAFSAAEKTAKRLFGADIAQSPTASKGEVTTQLSRLVAVHLRRGDYKRHCVNLSRWGSRYLGFNRMEGLIDKFDPDAFMSGLEGDDNTDEESRRKAKEGFYLSHCLPSVQQIVQRLRTVRQEYEENYVSLERAEQRYRLNKVYLLTNGWPSFVDELRIALLEDGWEAVFGTPDMESGDLTRQEKGVNVAIDMALAEKAEVFVGNGPVSEYRDVEDSKRLLHPIKQIPLTL